LLVAASSEPRASTTPSSHAAQPAHSEVNSIVQLRRSPVRGPGVRAFAQKGIAASDGLPRSRDHSVVCWRCEIRDVVAKNVEHARVFFAGSAALSSVLGYLVDVVGNEAVCLTMHGLRRFGIGRLHQAEDLARLLVHPV